MLTSVISRVGEVTVVTEAEVELGHERKTISGGLVATRIFVSANVSLFSLGIRDADLRHLLTIARYDVLLSSKNASKV